METKENYQEKNYCRFNIWRCIGFGTLGVIGFAAFILIGGAFIMLLWNALLPTLFHFTEITFWQAVGIAVLARLIFGVGHRRWHPCHHGAWKQGRYGYYGGYGFHPYRHWKFHGRKSENCRNYFNTWQYYDKFWEEEGEKAFQEYVRRKSENQDKGEKAE